MLAAGTGAVCLCGEIHREVMQDAGESWQGGLRGSSHIASGLREALWREGGGSVPELPGGTLEGVYSGRKRFGTSLAANLEKMIFFDLLVVLVGYLMSSLRAKSETKSVTPDTAFRFNSKD
jgi:hypothetical protein